MLLFRKKRVRTTCFFVFVCFCFFLCVCVYRFAVLLFRCRLICIDCALLSGCSQLVSICVAARRRRETRPINGQSKKLSVFCSFFFIFKYKTLLCLLVAFFVHHQAQYCTGAFGMLFSRRRHSIVFDDFARSWCFCSAVHQVARSIVTSCRCALHVVWTAVCGQTFLETEIEIREICFNCCEIPFNRRASPTHRAWALLRASCHVAFAIQDATATLNKDSPPTKNKKNIVSIRHRKGTASGLIVCYFFFFLKIKVILLPIGEHQAIVVRQELQLRRASASALAAALAVQHNSRQPPACMRERKFSRGQIKQLI